MADKGAPSHGGLRVWWMTTGEAGLRQQARGLALEISPAAEERVVRVNRLLAATPPGIFSLTMAGVASVEGALAPPWPDVLVSCGRRAGLAAMAVQRRGGAPMVTVHIQPPGAPAAFDLVVAMPHDRLSGDNVMHVETALHGLRADLLAKAARNPDPRFARLPRPWTGVLLGGATRHAPFTGGDARRLAERLDARREAVGGSLIITASRRTPAAVIVALGARYISDPSTFFWDGVGANPYLSLIACADALVVTGDSISMISEALATRAEVWIFENGAGRRHQAFLEALLRKSLVARLGDGPPAPRLEGLDATPAVAARVRGLIAAKLATAKI
jgi:mitochondrial fission protein ELM1